MLYPVTPLVSFGGVHDTVTLEALACVTLRSVGGSGAVGERTVRSWGATNHNTKMVRFPELGIPKIVNSCVSQNLSPSYK